MSKEITLARKVLKDSKGEKSFYCMQGLPQKVEILVYSPFRIYCFNATYEEAAALKAEFPEKNKSRDWKKWSEFFLDIVKSGKKTTGFFSDDIIFFEKYLKAQVFIKTGHNPKEILYRFGKSGDAPSVNFKFLKDFLCTIPAKSKKNYISAKMHDWKSPVTLMDGKSACVVMPVNLIYNTYISINDFLDFKVADYDILCA